MRFTAIALCLAAAVTASAVPAKRGLRPVQQADGTTIMIERVGNEHAHFTLDSEGNLLTLVDGMYRHARITESGMLVESATATPLTAEAFERRFNARRHGKSVRRMGSRRAASRSKAPEAIGKFPGSTFPGSGSPKALVILVDYQDVKFRTADARGYFSDMLNKPGFCHETYGGTGSCLDYFTEASMGQFTPQFDLYGPVTLPQKMAYYGGNINNDPEEDDERAHEMAIHACQILDPEVDFKQYDTDGDGYIDNVFIFYAGQGEASYGTADTVWPHAWNVTAADSLNTYRFDGVILDSYGCTNEWEVSRPDGIGTFCHEFSHVMGLPDLYATYSTLNCTPNTWDVLDYGPYNNDGRTPPTYSTFERNAMGWIELKELEAGTDVTISDLRTTNVGYCITNPANPKEFYLFESRNREGSDAYIPGDGMLVWHVDYDEEIWATNIVNNYSGHQYVDLVEADGRASKMSRTAGDCFPGSSNVTKLSLKWWDGTNTGLALSNIRRTGTDVTFHVAAVTDPGNGGGNGGDVKPPVTGGGTYTVAEVIASTDNDANATVRGHIVGWINGGTFSSGAHFDASENAVKTNLILADDPDEEWVEQCIPVQLPSGSVRNELNLSDNPELLGRRVELKGQLTKYFSVRGLKQVTSYRFISDDETILDEVTLPDASASGVMYDLMGRRVTTPRPGTLVITDGRLRRL